MPPCVWFRTLRYLDAFPLVCFPGSPTARHHDAIYEALLSRVMILDQSMVFYKLPRGSEGCAVTDDYITPNYITPR
jgi:hypothetical protein